MTKKILLIDSIKFPLTGIGRYTYELAKHFSALDDEILFCSTMKQKVYRCLEQILKEQDLLEKSAETRYLQRLAGRVRGVVKRNYFALTGYRFYTELKEKSALKNYTDSLVHSPNFYLPAVGGKKVVTFHDLSMFRYPECQEKATAKLLQKECTKTIDGATAIITDSFFSKEEISDFFAYPPEKIFVSYLAFDKNFKVRSNIECNAVLQKYNLKYKKFSLFVGTIEPRKNLITLIASYELLPPDIRKNFPLVVVGYKGWKSDHIHRMMEKAISQGWLKYLSYIAFDELSVLYSAATIFCMPSLYEGFGLPIVEAMASGTPVISSNTSSLPEIGGGAVELLNPLDVDGWKQAIEMLIDDEGRRDVLSSRGIKRSSLFSWEKCAIETMKIYDKI